jgi:hypothetical protein
VALHQRDRENGRRDDGNENSHPDARFVTDRVMTTEHG